MCALAIVDDITDDELSIMARVQKTQETLIREASSSSWVYSRISVHCL